MDIVVRGRLIECVKNKSKDGKKDYYSANVYFEGRMIRVGITADLYLELKPKEGQDIKIENVSLWCNGNYSLYVKEDVS